MRFDKAQQRSNDSERSVDFMINSTLGRRDFLKRSVAVGIAVPTVTTMLAACTEDADGDEPIQASDAADDADVGEAGEADEEAESDPDDDLISQREIDPSEIPGPPIDDGNAVHGGTIFVGGTTEPNSFDSILAYNLEAYWLSFQLYSGLMAYDYDPELPVPDLAEEYEVSDDGTRYTFRLRPGLLFSNDDPVTAHDVKYSLERCLSPEWQSWGAAYLFTIEGGREYNEGEADEVEGIVVEDDQTIVIQLAQADVTFLSVLALQQNFVVSEAHVEELGDEFARRPIGTGPFMVEEYDSANQRMIAVRNPNYIWSPLPYADSIELDWSLNDDNIVLRTERNEIDDSIYDLPSAHFDRITSDPQFEERLVELDSAATYWIVLNNSEPPFDDVRVRRALGMAIDVERIAQILRGTAAPLYGVFPRTSSAFDPDFRGFEFDPEQAQALLEEAGEAGLEFELSIGDSDTAREVGQSVQQDLSEIGVTAELNPQPGATLLERLQTGETMAAFTSWFQVLMDPHDIVGNIHHSRGGSNYGRINIPEVDEVIETALASQDEDERVELYSEVEELLIKEHAVQIPLYRPISTFFISERLRNYYRPPSSGGRYERMWLDE